MKTTEEFLNDYFDKQDELIKRNELWRMRFTLDEYLSEIEKIRDYANRKNESLNEYHIQRNIEGMISMMLMEIATKEEIKEQFDRNREGYEKDFAEEAPEVRKRLKLIKTPLSSRDIRNIYVWLYRKQITFEMISDDILNEFKKTIHYKRIIDRNSEE